MWIELSLKLTHLHTALALGELCIACEQTSDAREHRIIVCIEDIEFIEALWQILRSHITVPARTHRTQKPIDRA